MVGLNSHRVFKTGLLAAAATAAFGVFAYRAAEWSRGLDVETNPGACSTESLNVKIIPQMPMGSFDGGRTENSTVIQIVNHSGAVQNITARFYKENGTALDGVTLTAGESAIANGVLKAARIEKGGVLVISGGGTASAGVNGWGKITACADLSVTAFYELRDRATDVLQSRVSVPASSPNMSAFLIPRVPAGSAGLDLAFAIVNTAPGGTATLTAELKDARGRTIATKDISMPGESQRAGFIKDLFAPLDEPNGSGSYQYVKFSSDSPTFAATAVAFEGSTQTSVPIDVLQ